MVLYDFYCSSCKNKFEELVKYRSDGQYSDVACPKCTGYAKKLISMPNLGYTETKMNNFEYRAGFNYEKATHERRAAEAASHMGSSPYNEIDDISSGKYFGEIK